ncbi:MAG: short-subunit dehydrogenase [Bermanella sp.]|jgi:short-subunit dehydrogenase
MSQPWPEKYGRWALITGGAQGIGLEFARQCALLGLHLVIADRDGGELEHAAAKLAADFSALEIRSVCTDVGRDEFLGALEAACQGLEIGVLVNNAACGTVGQFLDTPESALRLQLQVNMLAPMRLIQAFVPAMAARGRGAVFNVSSRTGEIGSPYFSTYAASKAWMTNFSEGLWYELRDAGVDLFVLKPDQTATPGYLKHSPAEFGDGIQSVEDCVAEAFEYIGKCIGRIPVESGRQADAALKAMPIEDAVSANGEGMKQVFAGLLSK